MAAPRCKAGYKKKDGIITLTDDQASVTWTPLPGTGTPTVSLPILNITSKPRTVSYNDHTRRHR
jgi:transcription initiation factor TFIIH subunit 1